LKGETLASYYPRKISTVKDLRRIYKKEFYSENEEHEDFEEKHKMYALATFFWLCCC